MAPRENENNAGAKFWGDKRGALWYVMVFSGVVNCLWGKSLSLIRSLSSTSFPHHSHSFQAVQHFKFNVIYQVIMRFILLVAIYSVWQNNKINKQSSVQEGISRKVLK